MYKDGWEVDEQGREFRWEKAGGSDSFERVRVFRKPLGTVVKAPYPDNDFVEIFIPNNKTKATEAKPKEKGNNGWEVDEQGREFRWEKAGGSDSFERVRVFREPLGTVVKAPYPDNNFVHILIPNDKTKNEPKEPEEEKSFIKDLFDI